jgi:hypothetical protein
MFKKILGMGKLEIRYKLHAVHHWHSLHRPEEAIDGVGDNVPMYHHHHMAQNGAHSLATGLESPQSALSLVTEPLLDLRNFRNDKHKKKTFS